MREAKAKSDTAALIASAWAELAPIFIVGMTLAERDSSSVLGW